MKREGFQTVTTLNRFWLINLPIFFLLFVSYQFYSPFQLTLGYKIYFVFLAFVQASAIAWLALGLLPFVLSRLIPKRVLPLGFTVMIASVLVFYFLLDNFIYCLFRTHLNLALLQMIFSSAIGQIFNLFGNEYLVLLATFCIVLVMEIGFWRVVPRLRQGCNRLAYGLQGLTVLLWLVLQGIYVWADAIYHPGILMTSDLLPWFYGSTAKRFLSSHHFMESSNQRPGMGQTYPKAIAYPLKPLQIKPISKKLNIVVIGIDAWRYDSISAEIMPHLAAFSNKSSAYLNHYSGGNCTRAGLFSLFYSINPAMFDTLYKMGIGPLVFDVLAKQQYLIGAWTSASAVSPPFHRTIFANVPDFNPTLSGDSSVARDQEVTRRLIRLIKQAQAKEQPFFGFAFYDSAHAYEFPPPPFKPPFEPTQRLSILKVDNEESLRLVRNQYNNALYFLDGEINRILVALNQAGLMDKTVVVITADHGEEFNDNGLGFWGHNGNFTPAQTKVPLVVHWPGQRQKRRYTYTTSHYDVMPTLLNQVLGVKNPLPDYSLGYLLSDRTERPLIIMGSYSNTALFYAARQRIRIINRLGFIENQDLHGKKTMQNKLDGKKLGFAFDQMQRFLVQPVG